MKKVIEELKPIAVQRACRLALAHNKLSKINDIAIYENGVMIRFEESFVVSLTIHALICSDADFKKIIDEERRNNSSTKRD